MDLETWIAEQTAKAPSLPRRVRNSPELKDLSSLLLVAAEQGLASWDATPSETRAA